MIYDMTKTIFCKSGLRQARSKTKKSLKSVQLVFTCLLTKGVRTLQDFAPFQLQPLKIWGKIFEVNAAGRICKIKLDDCCAFVPQKICWIAWNLQNNAWKLQLTIFLHKLIRLHSVWNWVTDRVLRLVWVTIFSKIQTSDGH